MDCLIDIEKSSKCVVRVIVYIFFVGLDDKLYINFIIES